jgi:very-short-patch-repair endonuclease
MVYSRIIQEAKQNHGADKKIKSRARFLRKTMTSQEILLWDKLKNRKLCGKRFRRQHPYGIYILDFYCHESNLAIEIDGTIHRYKMDYDRERTEYIESTGLKVIRFSNDDIENKIDWVISQIEHL